jgi:hypothetical protein
MATLITAPDGPSAYLELVSRCVKDGVVRSSRNGPTRDLGLTIIEIGQPHRAYPVGVGRGLNRRIVAAEAVQLVGAFSDPDLLGMSFEPYREADGRFWGAYGDRIGYQLGDVVRKIKSSPDTRQAIIALWNPLLDAVPFKQDYPCTLSLTFSVGTNGHLDLDVVMRSNDVWLGTPYDWGQFTIMQQAVATLVDRRAGVYRHVAQSMHVYERNIPDALSKLHAEPEEVGDASFPPGLARKSDTPFDLIRRCRTLPYVDGHYLHSEQWYRNAVKSSDPRKI